MAIEHALQRAECPRERIASRNLRAVATQLPHHSSVVKVLDLHEPEQIAGFIDRSVPIVGIGGPVERVLGGQPPGDHSEHLFEDVADIEVLADLHVDDMREEVIEIDRAHERKQAKPAGQRSRRAEDIERGGVVAAGQWQTEEFQYVAMLRVLDGGVGEEPEVVRVRLTVFDRLPGRGIEAVAGITPSLTVTRCVKNPVAPCAADNYRAFTEIGDDPVVTRSAIEHHLP